MGRDIVIFRAERIAPRLSVSGAHRRAGITPTSDPTPPASIEDLDTEAGRPDTMADRLAAAGARGGS